MVGRPLKPIVLHLPPFLDNLSLNEIEICRSESSSLFNLPANGSEYANLGQDQSILNLPTRV